MASDSLSSPISVRTSCNNARLFKCAREDEADGKLRQRKALKVNEWKRMIMAWSAEWLPPSVCLVGLRTKGCKRSKDPIPPESDHRLRFPRRSARLLARERERERESEGTSQRIQTHRLQCLVFQVVREERECDVREGEKSGRKSFEESVWLSNSGARAQMRRKRRGRRLARRAPGERETDA